ncbi:DUF4255 domain-containing protein [Scytonema sp. UIC 10036]|nr:DUF4255 domain-containing protein [Scytonema sp. UIC 10036]
MSGMQPHSIQFERPTKTWEDQTTEPPINCFLYDLRENTELRFDRQQYVNIYLYTSTTHRDLYCTQG